VLLPALAWSALAQDPTPGAPVYTSASIVNSAANAGGYYAPNSFISIYGQNLAYVTKPIGRTMYPLVSLASWRLLWPGPAFAC